DFYGAGSGGPPPTLRWYFNGAPFEPPGSYPTYFTLRNVTTNQSGIYTLVASNSLSVATSIPPVSLTFVADAPFVINLPEQSEAIAGALVILRAKAVAGPPPVYQWRKDGVDLPGETNMALSLGAVKFAHAGTYEIVARNELGEVRYTHDFYV